MIEWLWNFRGYFQAAAVLALFTLALRRGGAPERRCSGILLAAIALARANEILAVGSDGTWSVAGFATDDLAYLAIDLIIFIALATVALRANRMYPLWMAGVQLTALLTHLAERTTTIVSPLAYAILNLSTFYLAIVFLGIGLWAHVRRLQAPVLYPDWLRDLPPSPAPMPWQSHSG